MYWTSVHHFQGPAFSIDSLSLLTPLAAATSACGSGGWHNHTCQISTKSVQGENDPSDSIDFRRCPYNGVNTSVLRAHRHTERERERERATRLHNFLPCRKLNQMRSFFGLHGTHLTSSTAPITTARPCRHCVTDTRIFPIHQLSGTGRVTGRDAEQRTGSEEFKCNWNKLVRPRWPYDMRPSARAEKYMCFIVIR